MRAFLALVVLAPLAALVSGCGASLSAVASAATKSNQQTSEHIEISSTTTAAGKSFTIKGDGDFQNDPALGAMTMSIAEPGKTLSIHEVLNGTTIYLSSDSFDGILPSGKRWLAVDYAAQAKKLGFDVTSLAAQSPTDTLQQLEKSGHVSKVGTDTIDGVATTHYVATLDPKYAAKLDNYSKSKAKIQPVDVWIDGSGLVRRLHLAFTADVTGAGAISTDETIDLSDYGEHVSVTVPSAAEILNAPSPSTSGGNP